VVVFLENTTRGTVVSVLSGADGSFAVGIDASPTDAVALRYADAAANQTDVELVRPVVPLELRVAPAAPMLFLAHGRERSVSVSVRFSDGSERELAQGEMTVENEDPVVASIDAAGVVRSLADGETRLRFAFGTPPYRPAAELGVRVRTQGEVVFDETVGVQGADVELGNGLAMRIPAGALPGDVSIRIEEFPLDAPLEIDRGGAPVKVLGLYRFTPDLQFQVPITLELPYLDPGPDLLGPDDGLVSMSTASPDLTDLVADSFAAPDDERPKQFFDRLNKVVRVLTDHFSYRVLMEVEDEEIAGSNPAQLVHQGVEVPVRTLVSTGFDTDKPAGGDQFVVHHATNPGVRVVTRVLFPPGSAGQRVRIDVSDSISGEDPFFMEGCQPEPCATTITRRIPADSLAIGFVAITAHDTLTLTFTRGTDVDSIDLQPSERVRNETPLALPNLGADMTTLITSRGQNEEVVLFQTNDEKGAHLFVTSKGVIYRLYPRTRNVGHAKNVNSISTGIEIQHTTSPADFYAGPQMDAVIALTDFLINDAASSTLVGERARWRRANRIATTLPNTDRTHAPIGDFEPFITHREADRDYLDNRLENPGACGSGFRKNDPCNYELDAVVGALAYDFPGRIDTRGGDLLQSKPALVPARGGAVTLEYGVRPTATTDPMHIDRFAGIPGTSAASDRRLETVENVVVAAGATDTLTSSDRIGNLIVRGTLELGTEDDVTLRVSGMVYVAPGGRIVGNGTASHPNGQNLTILSAGPVVLHGLVDLSGFSTNDTQPGHGGRLTVRSQAISPLLVPTIVTQGGDVMTYDEEVEEEPDLFGEGGPGGDVTIRGAAKGLIVLSGLKTPRTPPIDCDPLGGGPVLAGMRFPINTIPFARSAVSDTALWTSSYLAEPAAGAAPCARVAEFHPQIGLTRTQGRGIVTSGGMGASVRVRVRAASSILHGSPGGPGGDIRIGFPEDGNGVVQAGTIRFRGVSLLTGGATGMVRTTIPLVTLQGGPPVEDAPMIQLTGGAGGRGSAGILRSFFQEVVAGGVPLDLFFAPEGGNGGPGGAAGSIFVEPTAKVFPAPEAACTRMREVRGHDGGVPKDEPNRAIGVLQTFCATVDGAELEMLTLAFAKSPEGVDGGQCGIEGEEGSCELLALGGSGGVAGGSVLNRADSFAQEGSAGRSGPMGIGGPLTLPASIFSAVEPF
jgi:hypothetical protein